MQVEKYELITEIAMLCDELEETKRELAEARRETTTVLEVAEGDGLSDTDLELLRVGRKKVFAECIYSWQSVDAERDGKTGDIRCSDIGKFKENAFKQAPDFMSKDEFMEYFADEWAEAYADAKARAIDALLREEAEDE